MKKIICICALLATLVGLASCNYQAIDTTISFDRAIIHLPNGKTVEGEVERWRDFEEGDQLQVRIGGKTYLTHASNVCLISE